MDDIETILNTLVYDGKVEMTVIAAKEGTVGSVDGQVKLFRAVNAVLTPTGLIRTPCGLCPVTAPAGVRGSVQASADVSVPPQVFDDCHEGGEISPSTCIYIAGWLDF